MNSQTCQNCKNDFMIDPEDFDFYEKIQVPPPTFCWQCRFQRRCAYRNERSLKKAKSAKSGQYIFTLYPPSAGLTLYSQEEWYGDDWDQMATGRDYDFSRPFFNQLFDLFKVAPIFCRNVVQVINSDYCANASYLKNCYLMFQISSTEDSAYGNAVDNSKNCFDNSHLSKCERNHMCFMNLNCYQCFYSSQNTDCHGMWFSKNCRNSSNCVGCVNLVGKSYCLFNEQYTKEEYAKKVAEMKLNTWSGLQEQLKKSRAFWLQFPNKFMQGMKNENVTGEYLFNCKNVHSSYLVRESRDMKYVQYQAIPKNEDCYDITMWGENNQLCYEVIGSGMANGLKFSTECYENIRDVEYSMSCVSCQDCFGCVGLRKKQYCILNKQYSKEEYEALVPKIKKHMNDMPYIDKDGRVYKYGEFFPIELSPYGANSDIMQDHFDLSKEEALKQGYTWTETDKKEYESTMDASQLPDSIDDVQDEITKELIACVECKKAYRIIEKELGFYQTEKLPLPRTCLNCRHKHRIAQRNRTMLYDRTCAKCGAAIVTAYSPERKEIIYCESCYQQEVA
ncbi:MAG: hypothetical protein AAB420_03475 [Patescibacteria group bacterium]